MEYRQKLNKIHEFCKKQQTKTLCSLTKAFTVCMCMCMCRHVRVCGYVCMCGRLCVCLQNCNNARRPSTLSARPALPPLTAATEREMHVHGCVCVGIYVYMSTRCRCECV